MNKTEVRRYLLAKHGVVEENPFKMGVPVFKVGGKMFALINIGDWEGSINLKYHKESIEALRSSHEAIIPGYHMNKNHWNTLHISKLKDSVIKELIDISYDLVVDSLTRAKRQELNSNSW
ncbi:MAG: MmcQ/YjbR family DNA-binding protein [Clostridia bacterium]|jgi:predicted DNA-binding protein (MmcQ/YjbR family)|nr:MmcQ/YjbR family DNA-binding protein [Clostridia bacterium]